MRRLTSIFLTLSLLSLAVGAAAADPGSDQLRAKREATDVFKALARDADNNLLARAQTCEFAENWLDYPVDADVARKYLAIKVSAPGARIAPPNSRDLPVYADTVDPAGQRPEVFCSEEKAAEFFLKQWMTAAENDRDADGTIVAKPTLVVSPTGYSFPLFNTDFDKAILVSFRGTNYVMSAGGGTHADESPTSGYVGVVLEKAKGKWRVTATEALGVQKVAQVPMPPRRPAERKPTRQADATALNSSQ